MCLEPFTLDRSIETFNLYLLFHFTFFLVPSIFNSSFYLPALPSFRLSLYLILIYLLSFYYVFI